MPSHRVKFDPDATAELEFEGDSYMDYLPILIIACILIIIIYLIYKLFSKINELSKTITELTSNDDLSKIPKNKTLIENQPNVDPGPSGVIKEKMSEDLQSLPQSDVINPGHESLESISEDKLE